MRVHELAKEYGIKSTEFVDIIQDFGIDIKSHLSTLDDIQVATIKQNLAEKEEEPATFNIEAGNLTSRTGDNWTLGSEDSVVESDKVGIPSEEVQEALATNIKTAGQAREEYAKTVENIVENPGTWDSLAPRQADDTTSDSESDEEEDSELSFGQKAFSKAEKDRVKELREEEIKAKEILKAQEVIVEKPSGFFGWLKGLFS